MIGKHRKCGCDCRDSESQFELDSTFNPLCCHGACGGGNKPPCSFIVNWECAFVCDGDPRLVDRANWVGYPGMVLRPICNFRNACQYVDNPTLAIVQNNACTWLDMVAQLPVQQPSTPLCGPCSTDASGAYFGTWNVTLPQIDFTVPDVISMPEQTVPVSGGVGIARCGWSNYCDNGAGVPDPTCGIGVWAILINYQSGNRLSMCLTVRTSGVAFNHLASARYEAVVDPSVCPFTGPVPSPDIVLNLVGPCIPSLGDGNWPATITLNAGLTAGPVVPGPYESIQAASQWTLDISPNPTGSVIVGEPPPARIATLTHRDGYQYLARGVATSRSFENTFDCFGPTTFYLVNNGSEINCPNLPKTVCVTPGVRRELPLEPTCCQNCFKMDIAGMSDTQVPDQSIVFFQVPNTTQAFDGRHIDARCAFQAPLVAFGSPTEFGQVNIWCSSPLRTSPPPRSDQPSTAVMEIIWYFGFVAIDGNHSTVRSATYECNNFSCNGGHFTLIYGNTDVPSFDVVRHMCTRSLNRDYGPCPSAHCPSDLATMPSTQQTGDPSLVYDTEEHRCACMDPWCQCAPCEVWLFDSVTGEKYSVTSCGTGVPGTHGLDQSPGLCSPAGPIQGTAAGGVREISLTTDAGPVTVRVYCDGSEWKAEWYCNDSYVATTTMQVVGTCPLKLYGLAPEMPDCNISGGCIGVNCFECLTCEAPTVPGVDTSCCPDNLIPETLTITFTDAYLSGISVDLTYNGDTVTPTWSAFFNAHGCQYYFAISCSDGDFTATQYVTLDEVPIGIPTIVQVSLTCDPLMIIVNPGVGDWFSICSVFGGDSGTYSPVTGIITP